MLYKITKQYARGSEQPCAEFQEINEARAFIRGKLIEDAAMKVQIIYRIQEAFETIEVYDPSKGNVVVDSPASANKQGTSSAGGASRGAAFRPTPLNPTPRPSGLPHNWVVDDDGSDKEDEGGK